jgi:FkbM family methyltransferase
MPSPWRLSPVEVVLVVGLAVLATLVLTRDAPGHGGPTLVEDDLPRKLEQRYGKDHVSMGIEEWFIRDFLGDVRDGVFVDVGAWDPTKGSNTYRLERDFGWSGLAVDAIGEFAPKYKVLRPKSRFVTAFVGDQNSGTATLHVPDEISAVASGSESFVHNFTGKSLPRQVPRRTLNSLLDEAGITRFDFLSMDIELGEPAALRGFDIERYRPRLVCIEAHGETRQAILDYFAEYGYVLVGKYLPHDRVNLYFKPRG